MEQTFTGSETNPKKALIKLNKKNKKQKVLNPEIYSGFCCLYVVSGILNLGLKILNPKLQTKGTLISIY